MLINAIPEPKKWYCMVADTTSLITGVKSSIFSSFNLHFQRFFVQDVLGLGCLYHINELLIGKAIKFYDGERNSPASLPKGALYNFLILLQKEKLTPDQLISFTDLNIKPHTEVREFLSLLLDRKIDD